MALTFRRWVALALVGCAIAGVLVMRDTPEYQVNVTERDRLRARVNSLRNATARAAEHLRRLTVRDSALRALRQSRDTAPLFDRSFDQRTRADLVALMTEVNSRRTTVPAVPTRFVFVLDTVTNVRGVGRSGFGGALATDYVPPSDATGGSCVVIARVRSLGGQGRRLRAELTSDVTRRRLPGPCAFFESFGEPGPHVAEWLRQRGWGFAQNGEWAKKDPWVGPDWFGRSTQLVTLYDLMNRYGVSCAAGDDSSCVASVMDPRISRRRPVYRDNLVALADYNPYFHGDQIWIGTRWPLGSREWTLLSDMVLALGAERFQTFWTSNRTVEEAFQEAAGRSLASWTREWIISTYRVRPREPVTAGLGWGLAIIAAGAVVAVAAARRRQVG